MLPDTGTVRPFLQTPMLSIFLFAELFGIIPESGPYLIFVMMFVDELISFSVLSISSFVQDGHGMLSLLSASVRDSLWLKAFNLIFSLAVGGALYLLGL